MINVRQLLDSRFERSTHWHTSFMVHVQVHTLLAAQPWHAFAVGYALLTALFAQNFGEYRMLARIWRAAARLPWRLRTSLIDLDRQTAPHLQCPGPLPAWRPAGWALPLWMRRRWATCAPR